MGQGKKPPHQEEFFSPNSTWVWIFIGLLALFARFYKLTTLAVWPHYDEATTGYYAMALSRKWDPRLFYEDSQSPPGYLWGLGLFFKLFGSSLTTLWFFPALLSALAVPLSYLAARQFFSKSLSFLMTLAMAFSFWPLYTGRFSLMAVLVLLWECVVFFPLGKFLKARSSSQQGKWALILGCGTGLGFYTGLHWIMIAGVIGLTFSAASWKKSWRNLVLFLVPTGFFLFPLILAAFQPGYGNSFRHLFAFHQPIPWNEQIRVSFSYITALFWGLNPQSFTFQPVFGGLLNPVLASLFFFGTAVLFRNRILPLYRWLGAAMLLFLIPGLITKECEPLRVLPLLPLLMVVAALGFSHLYLKFSNKRWIPILVILLGLSFGFDFYHLAFRYHHLWDSLGNWKGYAKSIERYRAYGLLEQIRKEQGPGLVFSNFTPGLCDQSLAVADYAFNPLENPALSFEEAKWTAVLINVNYRPFLDKKWGSSKAYALSSDQSTSDGGWMLWVVPLTPVNRPIFENWARADRSLKGFVDENLSRPANQTFMKAASALKTAEPSMKGDPFLESCYWEQLSDLFVKESLLNREKPDGGFLDEGIEALNNAVKYGYPSAHLYNHLGFLWLLRQNIPEAQKAFRLALKAPLNLTDSNQHLP